MIVKKKGYIPLLILTIIFTILAVATAIPQSSASKTCFLGYKAHCPFTPWATIICLLLAGTTCVVRKRFFTSKKRRKQ
jgi:hypothetical protein